MKRPSLVALATYLALIAPATFGASDRANAKLEVRVVDRVDLASYMGLWYEINRIENEFQDNEPKAGEGVCVNVTAEYELLTNGKISVKNTCYRRSGAEVAKARARAVEGSNNAKLRVNFTGIKLLEWLGIGSGDYWILSLGEKNAEQMYTWVLVGSPALRYGWILSRTKDLPQSEIERALSAAASVGYDTKLFKSFKR